MKADKVNVTKVACECQYCGHVFEVVPEYRHRLLCGNSAAVANVERLIGSNAANMVFTDPPYNADYSSRVDERAPQAVGRHRQQRTPRG